MALAALCGWLAAASVLAVEIPDPYLATVPVLDQSQKEKARAIRHGLATVLVRISGSNRAGDNERIRISLRNPDSFMSEFSYSNLDQQTVEEGSKYRQLAKVRYDAQLINQLLQDADIPVWGSNRPELLAWVAIDDAGSQQTLSATGSHPVKAALEAEADRRGVPLIFPLMDLEDIDKLSFNDLWYLFRDKLEIASSRYSPEAILAGKLYRSADDRWSSRWLFIFNGSAINFETPSQEPGNGVAQALGVAADYLAQHYAVSSGESHSIDVTFEVMGVNSTSDYAQAVHYLEGIAMIRQVSLVAVEKDKLILNIRADGTLGKLQETIALDSKLIRRQNSADAPERQRVIYQWRAL